MRSGDDDARLTAKEIENAEEAEEAGDPEPDEAGDGDELRTDSADDEAGTKAPEPEHDAAQDAGPDTALGAGRKLGGRFRIEIAAGVVLAVICLVLWSIGPVHAMIRQSFTRVPTAYTELYFTSAPQLNGLDLSVPITVDAHYINVDSFSVKVWLTNAAGKTDYSTTLKLEAVHGIARTVQTVHLPVDAEILWVNLLGQSRTLHYRVAGNPLTAGPG